MNKYDDTISRQDAIDLFLAEGMVTAAIYIERMPSAQQWIPVSERLPEPNEIVFVSINGEVDADWIAVDNTGYASWYRCMKDVTSVDAWMPLPEPWRGEEP